MRNILDDEFYDAFAWQRESLNADRVSRLLDAILTSSPKDGFASFCAALDSSEEGTYAMLAQELQHNLRLERSEIKPKQEFLDEATSLVHRLHSCPALACVIGLLFRFTSM